MYWEPRVRHTYTHELIFIHMMEWQKRSFVYLFIVPSLKPEFVLDNVRLRFFPFRAGSKFDVTCIVLLTN